MEDTHKKRSASCCSGPSCCGEGKAGKPVPCRSCGRKSPPVPRSAARGLLKKSVRVPATGEFWLCDNPSCPVSYFTEEKAWLVSDCEVPLDFKDGSKKRYACYCNKLTFEDAAKAMRKTGVFSWGAVVKASKGKSAPCACSTKNPFGACCTGNSFKKAAEEAGYKFKGGCS